MIIVSKACDPRAIDADMEAVINGFIKDYGPLKMMPFMSDEQIMNLFREYGVMGEAKYFEELLREVKVYVAKHITWDYEVARARSSSRVNEIVEAIDNEWLFMREILRQTFHIGYCFGVAGEIDDCPESTDSDFDRLEPVLKWLYAYGMYAGTNKTIQGIRDRLIEQVDDVAEETQEGRFGSGGRPKPREST